MAFGIDDAIGLITGLLSGAAGASEEAKARKDELFQFLESLKQRQFEFERSQGVDEGLTAVDLQRTKEMAPMRDNAMAMLSARMGFAPQAFQPRDPFNPSATPAGSASDPTGVGAHMRTATANYKPGDGGVDTGVIDQLMKGMGYGKNAGAKTSLLHQSQMAPNAESIRKQQLKDAQEYARRNGLPVPPG